MHRCLNILEILSLICCEAGSSKKTLASFAMTCKSFTEPALDVIWAYQDTLANLLRCMPNGLWDMSDDQGNMSLNRAVSPSDWDRFFFYSRRVKSFRFDDRYQTRDYPTCPKFLETLYLCLPGSTVFPDLRTLRWCSYRDSATLPAIRMFLSPHLESLGVYVLESPAHLSLLSIIAAQCPLLKDVEIECSEDLTEQRQTFSAFTTGLHYLETLDVPSLDEVALDHLARLPKLTSLRLENQGQINNFPASLTADEVLFPSLRFFDITGDDLDTVMAIVPLLAHAPLAELEIHLPNMTPATRIAKCFRALAQYGSRCHHNLKSLFITSSWRSGVPPTDTEFTTYLVPAEHLFSLLSFSNLEKVTLTPPLGFDFDDAAIATVASAWPRLRDLYLCSTEVPHAPSRVTFAGLRSLAQHCPRLSILQLPLNAAGPFPQFKPVSGVPRVQQQCLQLIDVGRSPLGSPHAVAAFLSGLFPRLDNIMTDQDGVRHETEAAVAEHAEAIALHSRWKVVESLLPLLRKVRGEERSWMKPELR
ncbi:hypothetical protein C8R43DRAFT_920477 [Mycena crocata]|nr:hypothetical protein C8R43DRAFT_920477 [Mycena crocata]